MRKQGAFYLIMGGLLGLALLITARAGLSPTPLGAQTLKVSKTFRVSHLQQGTWTTYANGDAVQALAVQGDDLWIATYLGGLVRWDTADQTYVQYLYPQTDLPSNDVRAVDIDALGRVWVGTDRGLAMLSSDGGTIVAHHTGNSGLPSDDVTDVGVAPDGRVWVATDGGGLAVLDDHGTAEDLSDDDWTVYGLDDGLPSNRITALDFDEVGNLWIGTRSYPNPDPEGSATIGGGVCVFDGSSFSCYTTENSTIGSNNVMALCSGGGEDMWVATRGGGVTLFRGRQNSQTFNKSNSGLAANYVTACTQDAAGKVWFATAEAGEVGQGVSVYNDGSWATLTRSNSGLVCNNIHSIIADDSRRVWFGCKEVSGGPQGVSVLAPTGETWTTYDMTTSRIPSERITSITLDTIGNLWFGSNGQGALMYMRDYDRWRVYDRNTTGDGLPSNFVRHIAADSVGRLWVTTDKGGSVRSGSWTAYTRDTTNGGLTNDDLQTVAVDHLGKVWFGHAQGIDQLDHHGTPHDLDDDRWTYFRSNVLPGPDVRHIVRDASDRMWVATRYGVGVYDGARWTIYRTVDGLVSNDVQVIFPDARGGRVWVGTQNGVSVFDGDSQTWTSYTVENTGGGLVNNDIQSIYVDGWRRVWFATPQGVSIKDGDAWTTYTKNNSGLVANDVTSLLVDGWGLVWLGTRNDGVSAFDSSEWDSFATADHSLSSNRITDIAFGADGSVWVGTADMGLSVLRGTTTVTSTVWTNYSRATTGNQLASDKVRSVAIADDGRVWVGTVPYISGGWVGGGVSVLDPKSGSWTTYNKDNTGTTGLKGNWIQKIAIDAAGRVWIGTGVPRDQWIRTTPVGYGLTVHNSGTWTTYTRGNTYLGLSSDRIPDIAFDSQRRIWLATQPYLAGGALIGGGVSRLDLGDNGVPDPPGEGDDVWTSWTNDDGSGLVADGGKGDVLVVHVDRADMVWAGAWTGAWTCPDPPFCYSWAHGSLNEFTSLHWTAHEPFHESGPVSSIVSDFDNNLWVGTSWGGVRYLDDQGWQTVTTADSPLNSNDINVIRVAPDGDVWFGTDGGGISRYTPPSPTPTPSSTPTETATGTPTSAPTVTATWTPTATATETATVTATPSPSPTPVMHRIWLPLVFSCEPCVTREGWVFSLREGLGCWTADLSPDCPRDRTADLVGSVTMDLSQYDGLYVRVTGYDKPSCGVLPAGWFNVTRVEVLPVAPCSQTSTRTSTP